MANIFVMLRYTGADVWQKPTQYCKAIIPQLKINKQTNKQTEVLAAGEKT